MRSGLTAIVIFAALIGPAHADLESGVQPVAENLAFLCGRFVAVNRMCGAPPPSLLGLEDSFLESWEGGGASDADLGRLRTAWQRGEDAGESLVPACAAEPVRGGLQWQSTVADPPLLLAICSGRRPD